MNSPRRQHAETIDYLLVGLSPALIICMICSMVFYLLTVLYDGPFMLRLMYLLGLYSGAMVLVARIAIEQSRAYALGYMLALGGATLLVVPQFFVFRGPLAPFTYPLLIGFLVLIGWLADRITFDCTLIDDRQDASGQGLLQSLGWVGSDPQGHTSRRRLGPAESDATSLTGDSAGERPQDRREGDSRRVKRHNPGVWILYFALLAIPLFGVAQLLIPGDQPDRLARCRWLLSSYLLASFGLLTITSFLGLRRYLRQRRASMPADIAAGWLTSGFLLVLILLLVGWLLPLPSRLVERAEQWGLRGESSESLTSSRWGWGRESAQGGQQPGDARRVTQPSAETSGDRSGQPSSTTSGKTYGKDSSPTQRNDTEGSERARSDGERPSQRAESRRETGGEPSQAKGDQRESSAGESTPAESQRGDSGPGESQRGESDRQEAGRGETGRGESEPRAEPGSEAEAAQGSSRAEQQSDGRGDTRSADNAPSGQDRGTASSSALPRTPPQLPNMPAIGGWFGNLRWLLIIAIAIALLVLFFVQRQQLMAALGELWRWWQGLWPDKSKPGPSSGVANTVAELRAEPIPFSSFRNPFAGGRPDRAPAEIVRYTFAAAEAWGAERLLDRHPDETPEEYLERLKTTLPQAPWPLLAKLYNQVAYANQRPRPEQVQPLAKLWQQMR